METFGCCSHFKECSQEEVCMYPFDLDYEGCIYAKNLAIGKNFYANKNKKKEFPREKRIFLDCFDRNFKIGRRGSNGFSYPLTDEEYYIVNTAFKDNEIPHKEEMDICKCVMEGDEMEPANSKVVFTLLGCDKEFVIGNFNQCLILKRYSDGIERALISKGISARVEMIGSYAYKNSYDKTETFNNRVRESDKSLNKQKAENENLSKKIVETDKKVDKRNKLFDGAGYTQVSLFDLV
jgi:hypothetical protein